MKQPFLLLRLVLYAAAILLMAACGTENTASGPVAGLPSDTTYLCRNAREFSAHFDHSGEKAALLFNGESHTLLRDASTQAFADSAYALHLMDDGAAYLDRFDVPVMENCAPFPA